MKRKEINIDLLGIGRLLKGVQYLVFPAAAGIDLVHGLAEAGAEADATGALAGERPPPSRQKNAKEKGI